MGGVGGPPSELRALYKAACVTGERSGGVERRTKEWPNTKSTQNRKGMAGRGSGLGGLNAGT